MLQDVPKVVGGRVHSDCARNLASCRQALRADTGLLPNLHRFEPNLYNFLKRVSRLSLINLVALLAGIFTKPRLEFTFQNPTITQACMTKLFYSVQ